MKNKKFKVLFLAIFTLVIIALIPIVRAINATPTFETEYTYYNSKNKCRQENESS